jgi:hypothetical protein
MEIILHNAKHVADVDTHKNPPTWEIILHNANMLPMLTNIKKISEEN